MRLFVETDGLIGDTLMQTPALRAAAREAEVVVVTPPGSLAHQVLLHNPHVARFLSPEAARAARTPDDRRLAPSAWDALQHGIAHHRPMIEGFAAQYGVALDGPTLDLVLTDAERREGRTLLETFGTPHKVVVCARHSTSCTSVQRPGSPPNKCLPDALWRDVATWLVDLGYVPLAVGAAHEAGGDWPGPTLYGRPLRTVAALVAAARATACVDTGLRHVAAAVGADLACVSGAIPLWLIFAPPRDPEQRIVERYLPVAKVTTDVCKELVWKVI